MKSSMTQAIYNGMVMDHARFHLAAKTQIISR